MAALVRKYGIYSDFVAIRSTGVAMMQSAAAVQAKAGV
jgi:hypothetical protein